MARKLIKDATDKLHYFAQEYFHDVTSADKAVLVSGSALKTACLVYLANVGAQPTNLFFAANHLATGLTTGPSSRTMLTDDQLSNASRLSIIAGCGLAQEAAQYSGILNGATSIEECIGVVTGALAGVYGPRLLSQAANKVSKYYERKIAAGNAALEEMFSC